jgi:hypothetical protein
MFVLQINFDVFPLRNRKHGNQYKMQQNNQQHHQQQDAVDPEELNDELFAYEEYMKF